MYVSNAIKHNENFSTESLLIQGNLSILTPSSSIAVKSITTEHISALLLTRNVTQFIKECKYYY